MRVSVSQSSSREADVTFGQHVMRNELHFIVVDSGVDVQSRFDQSDDEHKSIV